MSRQQPLNPWNYKPWWCQPWSILLTGCLIVAGSWAVTKTIWVMALISMPILLWWIYFLLVWPRLIQLSGVMPDEEQETQNPVS
ncbi:DUF6737 family protein [Limnofasciculus baicalensis]|uniref:DUF6737 domain-containing protein n=1 Tax=Limnofasciculus baicalensis BBK-W-15 TaxID=2699891 RepID=A0AAE3GWY7_9CYAN|nr:DUF6737 family protein [Limnofasciculus baicalensis]MCP2731378.1 hypothetical protein [Limnofasciculus baicalensis BBK-W-15]